MELNIQVEAYSGPFELLYRLIEKNEIDICDIPIAEITDQYIRHMNSMPRSDMDSMSSFILLAATLLEIKSKMLLPGPAPEDEPDPREALVQKLLEYKKFKEISRRLLESGEKNLGRFYREPDYAALAEYGQRPPNVSEILDGITAELLMKAFREALLRSELKTDRVRAGYGTVYRDIFTVEEKSAFIRGILKSRGSIDFFDLFENAPRHEIVVTFLALLELIKSHEVRAYQDGLFGNIRLSATT